MTILSLDPPLIRCTEGEGGREPDPTLTATAPKPLASMTDRRQLQQQLRLQRIASQTWTWYRKRTAAHRAFNRRCTTSSTTPFISRTKRFVNNHPSPYSPAPLLYADLTVHNSSLKTSNPQIYLHGTSQGLSLMATRLLLEART